MSKSILKVLSVTLVLTLLMTMAALGAPDGTYKEDTDNANLTVVVITGVAANEQVTLLALPTGVALADATDSNIKYIDQIPANEEGIAKFNIPLKASEIDIYSGYASMGNDDLALQLTYDGSSATPKTYKVTFNIDGNMFKEVPVEEGGSINPLPEAPEVEGFTFKGWFVGEKEFTTATVITADLSVDAKYDKAVEIVYGELDGDGEITLNDAIITLDIALGTIQGTESQLAAANVDGEEKITLNDAILILDRALKTITEFPVEK